MCWKISILKPTKYTWYCILIKSEMFYILQFEFPVLRYELLNLFRVQVLPSFVSVVFTFFQQHCFLVKTFQHCLQQPDIDPSFNKYTFNVFLLPIVCLRFFFRFFSFFDWIIRPLNISIDAFTIDRNDVSLPSHRWTIGWQPLKNIVTNGWLTKNHWKTIGPNGWAGTIPSMAMVTLKTIDFLRW